jgi:hypothetical protein
VILRHPGIYLTQRMAIFKDQLGLGRKHVCLPYYPGIDPNQLGISVYASRLNHAVMRWLDLIKDSLLFRGWVYLLLLAALLVIAAFPPFRRHAVAVFALGSSGLLYALSYVFISTACDFRMYWWMVIVTLILPVLIFSEQINHLAEKVVTQLARTNHQHGN